MPASKFFSVVSASALLGLAAFAPIPTLNADTSPAFIMADDSGAAPDNSAINQRDRSAQEQTADQAGNQSSDVALMQKIRKAIVSDKSLSTYGQNIKIISQNGKVILKGPVKSEQEKQNIESKTMDIAGNGNVTDELSVTGDQ